MLDAFQKLLPKHCVQAEVSLTGFGTFLRGVEKRARRKSSEPTQKIDVPAVTIPKFKAGKNLKEALK